jgi:hypothetical protein
MIFIGLFFFAILTLSFDYLGFIRLPEFGSLARPALILDALLFGSLSAAALGRVIYDIWMRGHRTRLLSQRREIRRLEAERERAQYESLVLRRLEYLSREEIKCIADALRKKEQSFFASVRSPLASNCGHRVVLTIRIYVHSFLSTLRGTLYCAQSGVHRQGH